MTAQQILSASHTEPVISLRNLRVSYGEREILHGISFDVVRGETLVILGGSGSGKSTLLRTLVGLEKPTAGEIWIKGRGLAKNSTAGIDELILELKRAFHMTIIVVTHELASAFLIADRMLLIDKGNIVALGTTEEMRSSTQPRVRQFLDRIAEPEVSGELDYLQMLTAERPDAHNTAGKRG